MSQLQHSQTRTFSSVLKNFIPKSVACFRENYSFSNFRRDLFAGLTVGVIAFPFAVAAAIGANIPPERGIFTAIVAGFMISALGGSRVQIGGPTSTFIVILYGILVQYGFESLLVATLMAGVILIIFGLAGLGTYIKYMPYPVVTGLTTGIAIVIFSGQLKDFLGLSMGPVPMNFMERWTSYYRYLPTWDPTTLGVGIGTLGIILYFRRYKPQFPGAIIALGAATLITWLFNIDVETIGSRYGELPRSLPSPSFPKISFDQVLALIPDALKAYHEDLTLKEACLQMGLLSAAEFDEIVKVMTCIG